MNSYNDENRLCEPSSELVSEWTDQNRVKFLPESNLWQRLSGRSILIPSMKRFIDHGKHIVEDFRDINDWGFLIYIDDCPIGGEIELYWDQKGVRYVIGQNDGLVGFLNEVLDIEMPWIFDRYGVDAVEFMKTDEQSSSLHIKYSDRPFDWLYTATPRQIYEFAKSMYEDAWELHSRIEDTINGYYESVSA